MEDYIVDRDQACSVAKLQLEELYQMLEEEKSGIKLIIFFFIEIKS